MKNDYIYYNDSLNDELFYFSDNKNSSYNLYNCIIIPDKTLYCVNDMYFNTKRELKDYCNYKLISNNDTYIMDYYKALANQVDVIRKTPYNKQSIYLTVVDDNGYGIYNVQKSINTQNYIWDYKYGNLRQEYKAFKDHGIILENDIYQTIDDKLKEDLLKTRVLKNK